MCVCVCVSVFVFTREKERERQRQRERERLFVKRINDKCQTEKREKEGELKNKKEEGMCAYVCL